MIFPSGFTIYLPIVAKLENTPTPIPTITPIPTRTPLPTPNANPEPKLTNYLCGSTSNTVNCSGTYTNVGAKALCNITIPYIIFKTWGFGDYFYWNFIYYGMIPPSHSGDFVWQLGVPWTGQTTASFSGNITWVQGSSPTSCP